MLQSGWSFARRFARLPPLVEGKAVQKLFLECEAGPKAGAFFSNHQFFGQHHIHDDPFAEWPCWLCVVLPQSVSKRGARLVLGTRGAAGVQPVRLDVLGGGEAMWSMIH